MEFAKSHQLEVLMLMRCVAFHSLLRISELSVWSQPDILEPNWQTSYWGNHYPRLLAFKKILDPNDLLIVPQGVNSEQWDPEILCKTV